MDNRNDSKKHLFVFTRQLSNNSGKTFTTRGPDEAHNETKSGIIPRAVESIFAVLNAEAKKNPDSFSWSMKCSDILQKHNAPIKIQSCGEHITVADAAEFEVTTAEECMHHLWRGWGQHKFAETSTNRESSRSHAVFMLTLITEQIDGAVVNRRSSRLNLVDPPGSERQGQTNDTGEQLKEAGNINKSLSILAKIIRSLSIPKEVIVNIHPNAEFVGDTGSTLTFAVNCKKVKNTAHVNEAISTKDFETLKKENLLKENEKLQEDLAEQKEINVLEKKMDKAELEIFQIEKERDDAAAAEM
uniref:Kinesin motor domain-containing protein n=1 Tax=Panagrolaimus davidi TaxID=227884 RepID=A0A914QJZ4_9BILA